MIRAAIVGLGRWGRSLVASVQGKSDVIRAGMVLIVKVPAERADPALVPDAGKDAAGRKAPEAHPGASWEDHVRVRKGDSLSKIAARVGVSLADLMTWNRLSEKSKLKIGQRLVVYRPGTRPAPQSVEPAQALADVAGPRRLQAHARPHVGDHAPDRLRHRRRTAGQKALQLRTERLRGRDAAHGRLV